MASRVKGFCNLLSAWTLIIYASSIVNTEELPTFSVSYRGVTWDAASRRCQIAGKRLCLRKDLCQRNSENKWKPHKAIKYPKRNLWIPVADQYNEWLYMGLPNTRNCAKMTKTEGPPFWHPRACQINFVAEKYDSIKMRAFCSTTKAIFCCNNHSMSDGASPRPSSIYIFSRMQRIKPQYLFSLNKYLPEKTWTTDKAPWRKSGRLEGDLSMITLMSGYVKGRFEDPVYFCYRTFINSDKLSTTQHKVSKTWCDGRWNFNFFMYGSFSMENATGIQKLLVGTSSSSNRHSRISLKENSIFPADFEIYGPYDPNKPEAYVRSSKIAQNEECKGDTEILTTKTGIISSPNYPNKYNVRKTGNVNCSWKVKAPAGSVIKISFKSLKLSPPKMRVAIPFQFRRFHRKKEANYDFYSTCPFDRVDITNYGRFCGKNLPPIFYTIGNEVDISFFGRWGSTGTHFALYYEVLLPNHRLTEIPTDYTNTSVSWISANNTCYKEGKTLCKARDICIANSRPFYGVKHGDHWTPIQDEYNDWMQIGRGNIETCHRHNAVLGPPKWGIDHQICLNMNISLPCPLRNYVYCCYYPKSSRSMKLRKSQSITVNVYSTIQNGITFYKYVRKGIDNSQSFDSAKFWKMARRQNGEVTMFSLQSERSPNSDKVVYFCSSAVIPSIGRVRMAFAANLKPCEESGWKYLFHLYSKNQHAASSVKLYVGVYISRPSHTSINRVQFVPRFRSPQSFIIYASELSRNDTPIEDSTYPGNPGRCSKSITIVEAPAVLQSPGYPRSYSANSVCRWQVIMPKNNKQIGGRLKLVIEELRLEDPTDVLNIREIDPYISLSNETLTKPRKTTDGKDFTGNVAQLTLSTNRSFLLTFTSDGSISEKGFRIRFEVPSFECGGVIKKNGHVIKIPNYVYSNKENYNCQWTIYAPPNYNIEIRFITFNLTTDANCTERVGIEFMEEKRIFCGDSIPPKRVATENNIVNVSYISMTSLVSKHLKEDYRLYMKVMFIGIDATAAKPTSMIQCGIQSIPFSSPDPVSEKIVNGKVAVNGNFPWLVMIGRPGFTCGGTLISERFVLTATHCFIEFGMSNLKVPLTEYVITAGRYKRNIPSPGEQIFKVSAIFVHGGFQRFAARWTDRNGRTIFGVFPYNDITLAQLNRKAIFSSSASPACLPTQDAHVGDFCYVAGWGSVSSNKVVLAQALNFAKVPILDSSICGQWKEMRGTVMDNSLCAGFVHGGGDHCWGDSGGSLVCRGKYGNFYVNGIVSWSRECAGTRTPGMYTRVWKFVDWILEVINLNEALRRP